MPVEVDQAAPDLKHQHEVGQDIGISPDKVAKIHGDILKHQWAALTQTAAGLAKRPGGPELSSSPR